MQNQQVTNHIVQWLKEYAINAKAEGFVIGISGGIDSALTSVLCAKTGLKTIAISMPIFQHEKELIRAHTHQRQLSERYSNVENKEYDLSESFTVLKSVFEQEVQDHDLSMANTRSRLRMLTLYACAQPNGCLIAGTGNKVEDFGIGFYTKYGDGGVDLSPIADLTKTQVRDLARENGIDKSILEAAPTDGLWDSERTDEDQIGASYEELEWAMSYEGDSSLISDRQQEVIQIYERFNRANQHKMNPIPVCLIPKDLFN
jgi:NAD+ synthase